MDVVTKTVDAQVNPLPSAPDGPGEFEVVLSTDGLDRDGENLWAQEWKQPLPERIHIDGDHGRTLEKTVGSAIPHIDEHGRMIGKGRFASTPYAQMVRQLVNEGHINSLSVTYGESKSKDGAPVRELFNAAFVAIPANPEAIVLASKAAKQLDASGDNPKSPARHDDMVQAIHDAAVQLGGQCSANRTEADTGEDEGANKHTHTSHTKSVGSPQESPDDSPADAATKAAADVAPAQVPAEAAEKSADTTAQQAKLAARGRSLAFLMKQNSEDKD